MPLKSKNYNFFLVDQLFGIFFFYFLVEKYYKIFVCKDLIKVKVKTITFMWFPDSPA